MTVLVVSAILSGCASNSNITSGSFDSEDLVFAKPPLNIPKQPDLTLLPVNVTVEELSNGTSGIVLSKENFDRWLLNNKRVENYIRINNQILDQYREYYEPAN